MAYPEEPQRGLTPTQGAPAAAIAFFAIAFVGCLVVYLGFSVPGAWFPRGETQSIGFANFVVTRGSGNIDRDLLKGDALAISGTDETGLALVSATTDLRSSDYPIVSWEGSGFPAGADVRFLWRTDYAPAKLNSLSLTIAAGRLTPIVMKNNPDWVGRIKGVALAIRGPIAEPVRIGGVTLKPGGAMGQLADLFKEWFAFERWSGTSINTVTGGAEVQELPLPALLIVSIAAAAAAWFAIARKRRRIAAWPLVLGVLFVLAWLALDLQWIGNLSRQVAETRAIFGGKDWRERHRVSEDGELFGFIERARAKLPAEPARVFVLSDAAYFRGRGAYHLYPHNVHFDVFSNALPPVDLLKAGDYVVVYRRRGVQYNAEAKRLRFEGGPPIAAEAVLVEPGAVVFRIG